MNQKGQLSLEFLLIFTAGIAFLVFLFPIFTQLYNTAIFGIDVQTAKSFGFEFQNATAKLSAFEKDSTESISTDILTKWNFSIKENGEKQELIIKILDYDKNKELNFQLKGKIDLSSLQSSEFEKSIKLSLKKEEDKISVLSQP